MAEEKKQEIIPGMRVEASEGDLGEQDVSKARVEDVSRDARGDIESITVKKGAFFQKEIDVPVSRIQAVDVAKTAGNERGKVKIGVKEQELEALTRGREQDLPIEQDVEQDSLLDQVEQQVPTSEGMREMEANIAVPRSKRTLLRVIGPGLLSGTSGNDPSAITSYAIDGANTGYGQLWLLLLTTPLYYAVQFACGKIGRVSQKGLSQILREQYGRPVSFIVSIFLLSSNIALIAADLAAVGSGFQLITGLDWVWFVIPVAFGLWYLTVYRNFESFKKIFLAMSFVFIAYILSAFFTHANWGTVLAQTFIPHPGIDFTSISSAMALLGATISPYSMFWQTKAEVEERREGPFTQQLRMIKLDVGSGAIAGQLVAYFVIITTASTLFIHHGSIHTAADAASALEPLAGPLARYLFAVGLIGSGVVAIPVLLASTSYAMTDSFGWSGGLAQRPWQSEGFYLILTLAAIIAVVITLMRVDPIELIFWSNILAAIIAPLLIIVILLLGNRRSMMKNQRFSWLHNAALLVALVILIAGTVLLFFGLLTGQKS